ncbi:Nif11-like leader peptide family natural product precursor [Nisaea sp.]|uniref:Nif11-like leader peptide family natural product precursor n=1 Tax=Nisaea sp. TaxID=2024842 RepID=UPI003B52BB10
MDPSGATLVIGVILSAGDRVGSMGNDRGAAEMYSKRMARPLVNFLNRVSIDTEVKQELMIVLQRSRFARDITTFAQGLGYVFSEEDLHVALSYLIPKPDPANDSDLADDALDAVVGGTAGAPALPSDLLQAFGGLKFRDGSVFEPQVM